MASEQIEDALEAFVRSKQKGTDNGNYQRNARHAIEEWIDWLAGREKPIGTFDQLEVSHMRQYARHLKERVDRGELAGSTANTYWNYIAAFLGWCVYEELVVENPARTRRAEEELPGKRPRSDRQQFWSRVDREALLTHLNERAHTAVDEQGLGAVKELRDRALAALLAYSGVRGGRSFVIRTMSAEAGFAGATSISTPERLSCSGRIKPLRKPRSRDRRADHLTGCTRRSARQATTGPFSRRSTDRLFLGPFARGSQTLDTMILRLKRRSTSTTGWHSIEHTSSYHRYSRRTVGER